MSRLELKDGRWELVPYQPDAEDVVPWTDGSEAPTRANSITSDRLQSTEKDQTPRPRCPECNTVLDEEHFHQKQEGILDNTDTDIVTWTSPVDTSAEKPHNLPRWKKWSMTLLTSGITFTISFASSIFSTTIEATAAEFHTSPEVMLLGVSLYVVGFAVGPLLWGPMSEFTGRKLPLLGAFFVFAVFQIPVAMARNLETIFLCRFLAGMFGSAPLAINAAMFADYWNPSERGVATSIYASAVFAGPTLGPVVGSFITESHLGWRWTAWITLIMAAAAGIPACFFTPETYEPNLLQRKAVKLRNETHNWALHAKVEEEGQSGKTFVQKYMMKPFKMMALEPILLIITLYMSFVYGILYLLFYAVPFAYTTERGFSMTLSCLPFLAVLIGVCAACFLIFLYTKTYYAPRLRQRKGEVKPEDRLPPMILGTFLLSAGLFWFAWTASPSRVSSPWAQIVAGIPIGMGILFIFMCGLAYLVDVYGIHGSSAVSGNTCLRSLIAAGFVMFASPMYKGLGVAWGMSLLGFCCLGLGAAPIIFWCYGDRVRKMSKWGRKSEN